MRTKQIITSAATALLALIATPTSANWAIDNDAAATMSRMQSEDLLQIRANGYFAITLDAITSTPQMSGLTEKPSAKAKYAVIIDGVVDKIVTWDGYSPNRVIDNYGIIVKLPANAGVKYVYSKGITRLKPITQGAIVSVFVAPEVKVTPTYGITEISTVALALEPETPAVAQDNAPVVTTQVLNPNQSVSMTIEVPGVSNIPATSSVSVQTITDGRSITSIGLTPGQSTVTVNELPADQNVTVVTVIRDNLTNTETVISNPVVTTVASDAPAPVAARSESQDRASISAPSISSRVVDASGHLSVAISVPAIPNFNSDQTRVSLYVVDNRSGSTTAIGTDGTAQTLNVGSLGVGRDYTVKVVVRDLATGQETVINGDGISK
jgi:hypothetical protein